MTAPDLQRLRRVEVAIADNPGRPPEPVPPRRRADINQAIDEIVTRTFPRPHWVACLPIADMVRALEEYVEHVVFHAPRGGNRLSEQEQHEIQEAEAARRAEMDPGDVDRRHPV